MLKQLIIITDCLNGTQGDPSAAFKLIKSLVARIHEQQKIKINWILRDRESEQDFSSYETYIENAKKLGVNVILTDRNTKSIEDQLIKECDLICYFPFSQQQIKGKLAARSQYLGKPALFIGEYNLDYFYLDTIKTGLGDERLGIFLNDNLTPMQFDKSNTDILEKLGLLAAGAKIVNTPELEQYKKEHQLYFGYFNTNNTDSIANKVVVNSKNFIEICLQLSMLKQSKNVDIVVRTNVKVKDLSLGLISNSYSYIELTDDKGKVTAIKLNSNDNLPKIRIINAFPIDHDVFQLLMNIAEPLMALTGDQSFAEGIDYSAIIFYQAMTWKSELFSAFKKLCQDELPEAEELHSFNKQLSNDAYKDESFCLKLAQFLHVNESKIFMQMQAITEIIRNKYNLQKNLAEKILAVLEDPSIIDVYDDESDVMESTSGNQAEELSLSYSDVYNIKVHNIAEKLRRNSSLRKLSMHNTHLGSSAAGLILRALQKTTIEYIRFSKGYISDFGAGAFASFFKFNNTLTAVNLQNNEISDYGAEVISEALAENNSIKVINLSENNITDNGVKFFAQMMSKNIVLEELNLGENDINDPGAILFSDVLKEKNRTLKKLFLKDCGVSEDAAKPFKDAFDANSNLQEINLEGNFTMPTIPTQRLFRS